MDFLAIPLILAMAWFGSQGESTSGRVILLPDAGGTVGAVLVKTSKTEQLINTAYANARVSGQGDIIASPDEPALVRARYAEALAALPPRPVSFTVYFRSGSDTDLTPESVAVLEQLKAALASRPAPEIMVIGHTDRVGTLADNDALSVRRAGNVRNILAGAGVQGPAIDIAGRGEREPLVPTADEVAEEKNRRVEINLR